MSAQIIVSLVFLSLGIILVLFPAKKINNFYGFRIPNSKKTPQTWEYAQRLSGRLIFGSSVLILIVAYLCDLKLNVLFVCIICCLILTIVLVEVMLRRKFDE